MQKYDKAVGFICFVFCFFVCYCYAMQCICKVTSYSTIIAISNMQKNVYVSSLPQVLQKQHVHSACVSVPRQLKHASIFCICMFRAWRQSFKFRSIAKDCVIYCSRSKKFVKLQYLSLRIRIPAFMICDLKDCSNGFFLPYFLSFYLH